MKTYALVFTSLALFCFTLLACGVYPDKLDGTNHTAVLQKTGTKKVGLTANRLAGANASCGVNTTTCDTDKKL